MVDKSDHTSVEVRSLPQCDFCGTEGKVALAVFDGATTGGPWANMCERHYRIHGVGLGLGRGQKLILKKSEPKMEVKMVGGFPTVSIK